METLGAVRTAEVDMMVEGCWEEAAKGVNRAVERAEEEMAVAGRVGEEMEEEAMEEEEMAESKVVGTRAEAVMAVAG